MTLLNFEWDERKNRANKKKHGISFEEARTVFFDDNAIEFEDTGRSSDEDRFLLIGRSITQRVLLICHCSRQCDSVIRLISARKATKKERDIYSKGGRQ